MEKIGIITIYDLDNCGNRLQNYALQETLKKLNYEVYTLKNNKLLNSFENYFINSLKFLKRSVLFYLTNNKIKLKKYKNFDKLINYRKHYVTCKTKTLKNEYDFFIVGSDQVWKPTRMRMSYMDLLGFADSNQKISYAASFGISQISDKDEKKLNKYLKDFKHLSVREKTGQEIIKKATGREDVHVHVDPTMLLSKDEWIKLENKELYNNSKKLIFTYFLGDDNYIKKAYDKFNDLGYEIIEFNSHNNAYGPQDFLSLIHGASLVLTDSFHACVFSIIYQTNFYVLDRKENTTQNNMNSRLETLLEKFCLEERKIKNIKDIDIKINCDFKKTNEIIEREREKSIKYLMEALEIKGSDAK